LRFWRKREQAPALHKPAASIVHLPASVLARLCFASNTRSTRVPCFAVAQLRNLTVAVHGITAL
jgi:hypothetical protein